MSFLVYFFVLVVSAGSVLFGMDWLGAPMSPMPKGKPAIQTANRPAAPSPVPLRAEAPPKAVAAKPQSAGGVVPAPSATVAQANVSPAPNVPPAQSAPPEPAPATPAQQPEPAPLAAVAEPASIAASEPAAPPKPALCDVDACAAAYRTFTAEDCTYQPSNGPRRLCTRGEPPRLASQPGAALNARAQTCNINACAAAYGSFDASDCTYQPFDGPRRICTK